jgi:hypothetical protein
MCQEIKPTKSGKKQLKRYQKVKKVSKIDFNEWLIFEKRRVFTFIEMHFN